MLFKLGETIIKNGQSYRVVNFQPYVRYDGSKTELVCFVSRCADCGYGYEFKLPQGATRFEPRRRCDQHKKPGVKVQAAERTAHPVKPAPRPNVFD